MDDFGMPSGRKYGDYIAAKLRAVMGGNQTWLPNATGIKRGTVSSIVNGAAIEPPARQVGLVAQALGLTPNQIFKAAGWWVPDESDDALSDAEQEAVAVFRTIPSQLQPGRC